MCVCTLFPLPNHLIFGEDNVIEFTYYYLVIYYTSQHIIPPSTEALTTYLGQHNEAKEHDRLLYIYHYTKHTRELCSLIMSLSQKLKVLINLNSYTFFKL